MSKPSSPPFQKGTDLVIISFFSALMTVCAQISLPIFGIPITMQTMAVCCTAILLGAWRATIVIGIYLAMGLIGLPVFSGFQGGVAILIGPTGGYLIGFFLTVWIVGSISRFCHGKYRKQALFGAMFLGIAACYLFGALWFWLENLGSVSFHSTIAICVLPFLLPDLLKITLSLLLCTRLEPYFPQKKNGKNNLL